MLTLQFTRFVVVFCAFWINHCRSALLDWDYFMIVVFIRDVTSYTTHAEIYTTKVAVALHFVSIAKMTSDVVLDAVEGIHLSL